MISFKADMTGLTAAIKAFQSEQDAKTEQVASQLMVKGTGYIQDMCPVDTGNLQGSYTRDSITKKVQPCIYEVTWQSGVEYAPYVEYGTSRKGARPHLRPGAHRAIAEVKWPK